MLAPEEGRHQMLWKYGNMLRTIYGNRFNTQTYIEMSHEQFD
jgi:hypothetical protein